jgi:peptide methionine sulfoxide reductase
MSHAYLDPDRSPLRFDEDLDVALTICDIRRSSFRMAFEMRVGDTRVGWSGGWGDNPTEENPGGHAEAVEVVFDPERISYRDLLEYFLQVHRADLGEDLVGSEAQRPACLGL